MDSSWIMHACIPCIPWIINGCISFMDHENGESIFFEDGYQQNQKNWIFYSSLYHHWWIINGTLIQTMDSFFSCFFSESHRGSQEQQGLVPRVAEGIFRLLRSKGEVWNATAGRSSHGKGTKTMGKHGDLSNMAMGISWRYRWFVVIYGSSVVRDWA